MEHAWLRQESPVSAVSGDGANIEDGAPKAKWAEATLFYHHRYKN